MFHYLDRPLISANNRAPGRHPTKRQESWSYTLHRHPGFVPPNSIFDVERVSASVLCYARTWMHPPICHNYHRCPRGLFTILILYYSLRIIRSHGLPAEALHEVARSTTLGRLMYAALYVVGFRQCSSPHWSLHIKNDQNGLPTADVSSCLNRVLRAVFPRLIERRPGRLRSKPHNFTLPDKDDIHLIPPVLYGSLTH